MRRIDVGIVGAGTAGSAAALFLARAGHRVTLYERVANVAPVGAGITLQPTGLHVLSRLGLDADIVRRGARIDRLVCLTASGRPIVDLSYGTVSPRYFGLGLHRGVLFEVMLDAVRAEPNVALRTGCEIVAVSRHRDRVSGLRDASGQSYGPHDLVVVANGARTVLRDQTSLTKRVAEYPWGALWFVGACPENAPHEDVRCIRQVVDGNERFLGLLPTGMGPTAMGPTAMGPTAMGPTAMGPRGTGAQRPLVSLFWSIRCDRVRDWRARGLGPWKDEVAKLAPQAVAVVDQIESPDQVLFATYHDVVMQRWATRNVVYLGDAAHATSPQLGQGANLALWDAMVLADSLSAQSSHLALALDRYTRARADHLAFYQFATRLLTPFFQGDVRWLGVLRDLVMPLMCKLPLANRTMTQSMLGLVDGFFGAKLHLPVKTSSP